MTGGHRRIILSRKGSDAVAGGIPSPVLPDGRLAMVPILEPGTGIRAADLRVAGHPLYDLLTGLGVRRLRRGRRGWQPLSPTTELHADPDLDPAALPRLPGWRPALGQAGAAQTHLHRTAGVGAGDLFLFWGWYRHTGPAGWAGPAHGFHALHGWLEVAEVVLLDREGPAAAGPWSGRHPHVVMPDRRGNALYVGARRLSADPSLAGAGTFCWSEALRLSAPDSRLRSRWRVPPALVPEATAWPLTYHADPRRWTRDGANTYLDVQRQGQEFVVPANEGLEAWALGIVRAHAVPTGDRMASPLAKKLQVKPGNRVLLLNAPEGYAQRLNPLPEGVEVVDEPGGDFDVVHLFVRQKTEMDSFAAAARQALRPGGVLWVSYPKRSSKVSTDLTRDVGWDAFHQAGWRGVTQVAIDDVWSALRLRPQQDVGRTRATAP